MSEDNRLQKMREYILLADKLQDRIDNPNTRHNVAELGHILKEALVLGAKAQKSRQESERKKEDFYKLFDTKEEAEERLRKPKKQIPSCEPYITSAAAKAYGFAACIAACFSRDISKLLLRKKDLYYKISKNIADTIKLNKESKQLDDATIQLASKREFAEARFIDNIRKNGGIIDDEAEYALVKQPELLVYAILDNLKGEYAPEL